MTDHEKTEPTNAWDPEEAAAQRPAAPAGSMELPGDGDSPTVGDAEAEAEDDADA
jgi:hypothetical protein